ncbi:MAG TPA: serine hydrolase domain-containing protein [Baekduia sp.]|uniref:serine hydrolase domain-containing protein n=1 Tax=Baekduia sp. TaxID=2600305 RepID=UPI002D772600|nr:serine hydrolase domain-containing protein [Baekduia sp.]HET6507834.1 serine hydrolase domain-containing protein [Baekduia sp.]
MNVAAGARYDPVREVFASLLAEGRGGAGFAAVVGGRLVLDLTGGCAEPATGRPWGPHTAVTVFSGSKGLVAMCLALLVDRGALDLEAPVSRYWPEFAAAGKGDITVGRLASHSAGLVALASPPSADDLRDPAKLGRLLAAQAPDAALQGRPCYHPLTFGWLCGEVVRRVSGLPLAELFAAEIAGPAGADVRFGMPAQQQGRVAELFAGATWERNATRLRAEGAARMFGPAGLWSGERIGWNSSALRAAEIPGAGAIGTAAGMARCYARFAGQLDRRPPLVSAPTRTLVTEERAAGIDPLSDEPIRYGAGFQLQVPTRSYFGPPADAFGHGGAGGSSHGWWPSHDVAYSFVMNELREETQDRRARRLLEALFACLPTASGAR